ncbi:SMP-30/gluconolactonase/LRE family protein [Rhodococcus sp. IEGM 248]|uniref:SMP-30/gluconolactonase/LRE family protein n=1 Tax=Rhodococcus opacus TaxID=37919 RepID=UPI0013C008C4|nr:SMP-30/gluconolactonase/LRE family protein [Rhodococcus opacus]MDV7090158.1 SMP-30/gluconolactonase/LRE family protein [Rhodococcus opacus]NDV07803.1 SMP-30/gluconolactonase/LRE family protein [Rhodococcus sp. IEGM 248]
MATYQPTIFSTGHQFLEAPRWHDGKFWASDFFSEQVLTFAADGTATPITKVPGRPSGLGFLPDGTPLVVSQNERSVYRITAGGTLEQYADFSALAGGIGNDLYVSPAGDAYAGNFGFALGEEDPKPTHLVHIRADGSVSQVPGDLIFPNGCARTPNGTLLVAETFPHRISAFDMAEDGGLTNHRVWAQLDESFHPDGIALDSDGGLWFGNALTLGADSGFYRVVEGGQITDKVEVTDTWAVACAFGGENLDTLYLCCNTTTLEEFHEGRSTAHVAVAQVGRTGVPASI